jgi:hypothetical protein
MGMRWKQRAVQSWARVGAAALVALTLTWTAAAIASAQPIARAASRCSLVGKYQKLGPTYAEQLSVSHTNCTTGVNVIKAYNQCRLKAGGLKGHCHGKVLGFSCTEKRYPGPIQFIGKAKCTSGRKLVTFTYSENDT